MQFAIIVAVDWNQPKTYIGAWVGLQGLNFSTHFINTHAFNEMFRIYTSESHLIANFGACTRIKLCTFVWICVLSVAKCVRTQIPHGKMCHFAFSIPFSSSYIRIFKFNGKSIYNEINFTAHFPLALFPFLQFSFGLNAKCFTSWRS